MVDTFKELYITKKTTLQDKLIGYVGGIVLLLLGLAFLGLGIVSTILFWIVAIACFAGAFFCSRVLNKEYDYTYVNGDIDVDVVRGKKSRKHLKTIQCSQMLSLSPNKDRRTFKAKGKIRDYTSMDPSVPFAEMQYPGKNGTESLLLELSEDILSDLRVRYPRQVERY